MADIRINALANTATSAASDDYLALDGSANGTRKILATNVAQNVTDVTLGSAGPSVKSTLSARAPRQGLVFDGTDTSTISTAVPAFGTADFSVSTWLYTDLTVNVQGFIGSTVVGGIGFYTLTDGTIGRQKLGTGGDSTPAGVISANKWSLFTYTRASGVATFYVNGLSVYSVADTFNYTQTISMLGGFAGGNNYKGTVAPLIYNRALSASEVVALYEAGAPSASDYASGGANNTSYITGANSTFSSDTGFWTKAFSASIGSGQCTLPSGGGVIYVTGLLVKGTKYRLSVNIITNDTSGLYVQNMADVGYGYISGTGVKTFEFTASGSGAANFGLQNQTGVASIVIDDVTLVPIGLLLAPDAAQAGNGYVWNDQSGNLAQIVLPSSGVQWNLPSVAGQRIRGTTSTNGNQQLLGASVLLPAESQITHVRARARSGTPTITIGTASGGAQIVASVALSTTWLNCTIALTGGIVSSADDIWIGSNSTDVVEIDIAFQPLDF